MRKLFHLLFQKKYLLATNTVSSGVLMFIGDCASQALENRSQKNEKDRRLDWERLGRMSLVGLSQGPLHHYLYKWLDALLPGATPRIIFQKIMADQIVIGPIFIVTFFYSTGYLERQPLRDINREFSNKWLTIYTADWIIWPVVQAINFYYLRPRHRVIFINGVTSLYNIFLSFVKHQSSDEGTTVD